MLEIHEKLKIGGSVEFFGWQCGCPRIVYTEIHDVKKIMCGVCGDIFHQADILDPMIYMEKKHCGSVKGVESVQNVENSNG